MVNLIEDETKDSYTIRGDLMKDGDMLQCRDDKDMHVKKQGNTIILVKKSHQIFPFKK